MGKQPPANSSNAPSPVSRALQQPHSTESLLANLGRAAEAAQGPLQSSALTGLLRSSSPPCHAQASASAGPLPQGPEVLQEQAIELLASAMQSMGLGGDQPTFHREDPALKLVGAALAPFAQHSIGLGRS
ncbi:hypothetical protein WJX74_005061 [Apatococcus lobatus]|uniref:Uncharacterized protein n=1 Tax=Apatococcus lobatus TaxID=904363 RepID=A0AAW1QU58_9CHLO